MYARASGLLSLPAPKPLPIDGSAICYNAATRSIVTFAPHTRMLRALGPDGGGVRARPVPESAVAGALGRPLLAALAGDLVVLTAGDGVLQVGGWIGWLKAVVACKQWWAVWHCYTTKVHVYVLLSDECLGQLD